MVGFSTSMMRSIATLAGQAEQSGQRGVFAVNTSNNQMGFVRDGTKRGNNLDKTAFRDRLFNGLRDEFVAQGKPASEAADLAKQLLGAAKIDRPSTDANGNINKGTFGTKSVRDNQLDQVLSSARAHVSRLSAPRNQRLGPNIATDINYNPLHSSNAPNAPVSQNVKSTHLKPQIQQQHLSQDFATDISYGLGANPASNAQANNVRSNPPLPNQPISRQEIEQIVHASGVTPGMLPPSHPSVNIDNSLSEDDDMYDKGNDNSVSEDDDMYDKGNDAQNQLTPMGMTPNGGRVVQQQGNHPLHPNNDAELQIENAKDNGNSKTGNNASVNEKTAGFDLGNKHDEGIEESRSDSASLLSSDGSEHEDFFANEESVDVSPTPNGQSKGADLQPKGWGKDGDI
jgi:hypothetical protein